MRSVWAFVAFHATEVVAERVFDEQVESGRSLLQVASRGKEEVNEDTEPNCDDIGTAQFEQDFKEAMIDAAEEADGATEWEFHQGACQYKFQNQASSTSRRKVKRTYEFPPKSEQQKVPCEDVAQFCAQACKKEETCMGFEVTLQRGLSEYSWCKIHGTEDEDLPMMQLPIGYDMDWHPVPSRRRQKQYPLRKPENIYTGDATMSTYCMARVGGGGKTINIDPTPAPTPTPCRPPRDKFLLCEAEVVKDVQKGKLRSVLYKNAGFLGGKPVDLLVSVSADTPYMGKPDRCGRNGCVGLLNIKSNNEVGFDFKLLESGTDIAVFADEVYFEVLDMDCGAVSRDAPEVCDATEFATVESNMKVETQGWEIEATPWHNGGTRYKATVVGDGSDNPSNTTQLEKLALGRALRGSYKKVANWHVSFGVTGGKGYRNFLFDVSTTRC